MKYLFCILGLLIFINFNSFSQDIAGSWKGDLKVMGQTIPLITHFEEVDGEWIGTMDSPNQGAMGIPMKKVLANQLMVSFEMSVMNASYEGVMQGDEIKGNFSQGGMKFPLDLKRVTSGELEELGPKRPQLPVGPFDYDVVEVGFENSSDNIKLAGTLTKPKGEGEFPAVILVTGSGPHNRDHEMVGHKPFWVMADYLTKNGIVVLRYDERGVGESNGDFSTANIEDLKNDVVSGIEFLKKHPSVNLEKIGVVGHSEGGLITWILGSEGHDLSFLVSLAGPVVPIKDLMTKQTEELVKVSGAPELLVKSETNKNRKIYQAVIDSKSDEEWKAALKPIFEASLKELNIPESQWPNAIIKSQEAYEHQLTPSMIYFLKINPENYIKEIDVPVFAGFGSKDLQVVASQNGNRLIELFEGKSDLLTLKVYDNLNHLFQTAKTGGTNEYGTIEESFNEKVLSDILEFIKKQ
ncbi:alpha/beta hydrolase [Belliella sp. R4-6]|uniref:Alpha/beta hydrolase n=1 Tax=Belliella alkalica TaxID=1730871 RepID=A0ABS9V8A5_9BACT|nr:alpha/beta hydrolase [Belliella alkalica]MCH7412178.1 alpha/beta hydrolase [Belliella alkalica]